VGTDAVDASDIADLGYLKDMREARMFAVFLNSSPLPRGLGSSSALSYLIDGGG
jgi:hypothetical protein